MTPGEVAEVFRVGPKTVTRWAKAGKLTAIRTLGGHRRFRAAEVTSLLAGRADPAADVLTGQIRRSSVVRTESVRLAPTGRQTEVCRGRPAGVLPEWAPARSARGGRRLPAVRPRLAGARAPHVRLSRVLSGRESAGA
jgi:excisionase family DNA binding protein